MRPPIWPRVTLMPGERRTAHYQCPGVVRRLERGDGRHLTQMSEELAWISKTWGGPAGLVRSNVAWGAFVAERPVAVACSFFCGDEYEEIAVVTEPAFRRNGFSTACAAALIDDIHARGRLPNWTTTPSNSANIRVAEKLGFEPVREWVLYVLGVDVTQ